MIVDFIIPVFHCNRLIALLWFYGIMYSLKFIRVHSRVCYDYLFNCTSLKINNNYCVVENMPMTVFVRSLIFDNTMYVVWNIVYRSFDIEIQIFVERFSRVIDVVTFHWVIILLQNVIVIIHRNNVIHNIMVIVNL